MGIIAVGSDVRNLFMFYTLHLLGIGPGIRVSRLSSITQCIVSAEQVAHSVNKGCIDLRSYKTRSLRLSYLPECPCLTYSIDTLNHYVACCSHGNYAPMAWRSLPKLPVANQTGCSWVSRRTPYQINKPTVGRSAIKLLLHVGALSAPTVLST